MGLEYETKGIDPANIALVPILRSGLGMIDGKYLNFYKHFHFMEAVANIFTNLQL